MHNVTHKVMMIVTLRTRCDHQHFIMLRKSAHNDSHNITHNVMGLNDYAQGS